MLPPERTMNVCIFFAVMVLDSHICFESAPLPMARVVPHDESFILLSRVICFQYHSPRVLLSII